MIRFVLRVIGFFALAAAFIAFVIDGTKSIAGNALTVTPLIKTWTELHPASLQRLEGALTTSADWLWMPFSDYVLQAPTAAVLGVVGIVFLLLGRKKRRLIGYTRE